MALYNQRHPVFMHMWAKRSRYASLRSAIYMFSHSNGKLVLPSNKEASD